MKKKKNNSEFAKNNHKNDNLSILLIPVSIILAGILIMVSILISATTILDRKDLVTQSNLKAAVAEAVKGLNLTAGTGTPTTTPAPTVTIDQIKSLFTASDSIKFGDANRKVLFVEFSDPSCPYCHIAGGKNPELNKDAGSTFLLVKDGGTYLAPVEEMKKLVDEGKASFFWGYTDGHGNGLMGSEAMYCSYEQGKFWPVHDLLMSKEGYSLLNDSVKNDRTKSGELSEFLKSAIDPAFMKSCLDSAKYSQKLQSDQQLAATLGVSGTPGFFVNTQNFAGAYSYKDMEASVKTALDQ